MDLVKMLYWSAFASILFLSLCIFLPIFSKGNISSSFKELMDNILYKNKKTTKKDYFPETITRIIIVVSYSVIILFSINISIFITDLIMENAATSASAKSEIEVDDKTKLKNEIKEELKREFDDEPKSRIGALGTFGDFFGGTLNPILTFLTFICLLITIALQRKELFLTRKELKKSAKEQRKSANAANSQVAEATIFNLINLHRSIFNDITYKPIDSDKLEPIEAFRFFARNCTDGNYNQDLVFTKHELKYKGLVENGNYVFGSYFRVLYQILSAIDSYDSTLLSDTQKKRYTKILRSYLSIPELTLLMLNCLDGMCDRGEFKLLLIKYEMLKHVPISEKNKSPIGVNTYLVGNCIRVPEYFLYEYINISTISGDGVNNAFGFKRNIIYGLARIISQRNIEAESIAKKIYLKRSIEKIDSLIDKVSQIKIKTQNITINQSGSNELIDEALRFRGEIIELLDFILNELKSLKSHFQIEENGDNPSADRDLFPLVLSMQEQTIISSVKIKESPILIKIDSNNMEYDPAYGFQSKNEYTDLIISEYLNCKECFFDSEAITFDDILDANVFKFICDHKNIDEKMYFVLPK